MESKQVRLLIIVVIILAIGLFIIAPYNSMIQLRNNVYEQKAQIENVLQARVEKIPDLVATVKEYTKHEEEVFTQVAKARAGLAEAIQTGDIEKMETANGELSTALKQLDVVVEAYPELKASELYRGLMDEISGSVNRISQERRTYNKVVTEYNNKLQTFPTVMYAGMLGFTPEKYFEASEEAHKTNVVDFGD